MPLPAPLLHLLWKFTRQREVAPHVGAWIEIRLGDYIIIALVVAPHVGAWIEIVCNNAFIVPIEVAPHVGAWIEMLTLAVS